MVLFRLAVLLLLLAGVKASKETCANFKKGRGDFILNTEDSVKDGATYIDNLTIRTAEECLTECCENARCNLALVEGSEDAVTSCFLFDCLYRNKYVCRFVKKTGFTSYILDSVYESYLGGNRGTSEDRRPIANAGPDLVVRPGERVTLNGIESWDDEKIIKYDWKLLKGNNSVVIEKTDLPDQLILSNLHSGVYKFQLTVTDSADQSDSTSVTVLVLTAEQSERYCLTQKKVGPCRGSFPRWHYNAASNRCEEFTFGGCLANSNNYLSLQECADACNGTKVPSEGRMVKAVAEVCGSTCEESEFICSNGCCLDQSLACDEVAQCSDGSDESTCQLLYKTLAQLMEIEVNDETARCVEPPMTGPCRASFTHWYYDPLNQNCQRFTYGGCGGNKNNFDSRDNCMEACKGITEKDVFARGLFERSEQDEQEHRSGSVATAVILAVVILVLLALLGFYILKKRKSEAQRQRVPTANPAVNLAEDTEHLVYKPTTTTTTS